MHSRPRAVRTALVTGVLALAGLGASTAQAADTPIYLDRSYSFEERAADLVSRMTPAEKASQTISSMAPAIPRLGLPAYGWWNEALHGVSRLQYLPNANATQLTNTTSYPIDQSLGSSWDPKLIHRVASAISDEAREVAPDNRLNLDFYSPTMNLERDPRWGRNDEAYGEDPFLVTKLVDQFVNGMEGKNTNGKLLPESGGYRKTITTIKHYAANNSEVNRRSGSSDMDDRTLREYYTKAFRDIIRQADPGSVMSAYNSVNGTPVSADPYLLDTLLRQTFGFTGYVTSDCDAVFEMVRSHHWQPPSWTRPIDNTERNAFAQAAGTDLNCNTGYRDQYNYANRLPAAIKEQIQTLAGRYTENDLDTSLVRLFTARMQLGEFDDADRVPWVKAARARVAQGSWTNDESNGAKTETPDRLALAREAGAKSIVLLKNDATKRSDGTTSPLLPLEVPHAGAFKVAVIGALANPDPGNLYLGGYSSAQGPAGQANEVNGYQGLRSAIQAIDPDAQVDFLRGFTGTATTAAGLDTVDPDAVAKAAGYDAVIVYTGTDAGTANEDRDRASLELPGAQGELIRRVAEANPNTIAYMETIGPMQVSAFESQVPALLWSSYNGQRKGEALADVVLGKQDPQGHLPSTWYRSVDQLPDITSYAITPANGRNGRTLWYFSGPVAYPFGHGLSYTDFRYSDVKVSDAAVDANGREKVSLTVTNDGPVAGVDTPQLYVSTPDAPASANRPLQRLEGFRQVSLKPGQSKTVTLTVKVPDLAFYDASAGRWTVDTGRYAFAVGRSSADIRATRDVTVSGTLQPVPQTVTVKPRMAGDTVRDVQQRVQFPAGAVVEPALTVAMSDDTLYGAIRKNGSKPLPAGMKVTYSSDRSSVVRVDGGTIRTVAPGVTTLTAKVRYAGRTKSRAFVVRVVSAISDLTVDGRPLASTSPGAAFDWDTSDYDVVVPDGQDAPQVAAVRADAGASVDVTQAAGVPGTATVEVSGPAGVSRTYTVHFAHPVRSDAFDGSALGAAWSVVRPEAGAVSTGGGRLSITPGAGDLAGATNTAPNLVLQPAAGDWAIQTKVDLTSAPSLTGQQAGLIAYQGDDDYLKLGWEFSGGAARLTEVTEDSLSGAPVTVTLASLPTASLLPEGAHAVWLRMVKDGVRYRTFYSADGRDWRFVYETGAALRSLQVGVFAYRAAAAASEWTAAFDGFQAEGATSPAAMVAAGGVTVGRDGRGTVRVRCGASSGSRCRGVLTAPGGREQAFSVPANRTTAVRLRLPRRGAVRLLTRGADGRLRAASARVVPVRAR